LGASFGTAESFHSNITERICSLLRRSGEGEMQSIDAGWLMKTEPKVTKADVISWCPKRLHGDQDDGTHADVPGLTNENAVDYGKDTVNLELRDQVLSVFRKVKQQNDSSDPETGPRFVLQWRIFPNASNQISRDPNQCGCGCSCGCR
jgi:hypothetical protein